MTTLWIVRHGNTFARGEAPRRIGLRTDLPLVDSGRRQASALGRHLAHAGVVFARTLCSPLLRARETATLLLAEMAAKPAIQDAEWLAEIDHGPDENQAEATVVRRIGTDALAAWDRAGIAPPGWRVDVESRVAWWRTLFADAAGGFDACGDWLIVTSNGAARFALDARADLAWRVPVPASRKLRTGAWGTIDVAREPPAVLAWDRRPDDAQASPA